MLKSGDINIVAGKQYVFRPYPDGMIGCDGCAAKTSDRLNRGSLCEQIANTCGCDGGIWIDESRQKPAAIPPLNTVNAAAARALRLWEEQADYETFSKAMGILKIALEKEAEQKKAIAK